MAIRARGPVTPKFNNPTTLRGTRVGYKGIKTANKATTPKPSGLSIKSRPTISKKLNTVSNKSPSLKYLRQKAVNQAWQQEFQLVRKTGQGSRPWTNRQLKQLEKGEKIKKYVGHHIRSVNGHNKRWAGDPRNIKFVTRRAHFRKEHKNNFRNPTTGKLIDRQKMMRANQIKRRNPKK